MQLQAHHTILSSHVPRPFLSLRRTLEIRRKTLTPGPDNGVAMGAARRRSEGGLCGGWGLLLVAVAGCGAAGRSVGSASARAAAPGSLAVRVLPLWVPFMGGSRPARRRSEGGRGGGWGLRLVDALESLLGQVGHLAWACAVPMCVRGPMYAHGHVCVCARA
jgi:hypothetical protein